MGTETGQPVLVGVDGSDSALGAVRWAADEAARLGAPLRLVTVFGWTEEPTAGRPGVDVGFLERLRADAGPLVAEAAQVATERQPDVPRETAVRGGSPIGTLVEEARSARLLVIGDRGLGRVEGLLLGSVGVAMVAHAECPVVVVRGEVPADPAAPVVVGVDATPVGDTALGYAFEAAAQRGAPLVAVHSWWDTPLDQSPAVLFRDEDQTHEERRLTERLAGWVQKYPQVALTPVVARSRPATLLLERSRGAQLVVVGSRGHGELAGMVLGSVSNTLVHRAECPVAVVRAHPDHH